MSWEESHRVLWHTPNKPADISVGRKRIAQALKRRGFEVTVRGTTPRTVVLSLREIRAYDAVVGTTRAGGLAAALLGTAGQIPILVDHVDPIIQFYDTHPWWIARAVDRLETVAFRAADHVFYVYERERERVERHAASHAETDLGVEYERFADPDPTVLKAAAEHLSTTSGRSNIVIYIGGLEPRYNVSVLLDAVEHLSEWSLVVIGAGSLERIVQRRAESRDDIEFLGTVPYEHVPGYLHQADVGISLVNDPHTLKVLEYLAASLSVVQVDGVAREQFGDLVTYCSLDPTDVAESVETAANTPVGKSGHEFVRQFSWSSITDQYEDVLQRVINDQAGTP